MVYPFSNGGCVVGYISNTIWQFFLLKMEKNVELERICKVIVLLRKLSEYQDDLNDFVNEISDNDDNYHEFVMEKLQQPFSAYFDAIKENLADMLVIDYAFTKKKRLPYKFIG